MSLSKEVTSEKLDELPQCWSVLRIKYGFRLIGSGTTPPTSEALYYDGAVPWVNTSELRENVLFSTEKTLTTEAIEEFSALRTYPAGTVLIAMYGATIGRVAILGIASTVNQAVCALAEPNRFTPRFAFYGLQASRELLAASSSGGGQPNLNAEKVREHKLPCPSLKSQRAIADYLDRETARLDALVAAKERVLGLLAEKRRALITRAVTRGLDPRAPLRDSGIPWLGEIPAHWETERTRWLFKERDQRSETGAEELLTVSHLTGVTPRSEKDVNMFEAETTEGYKICFSGDLVINTLWAWMGAMGVSPVDGIASPAYNVYEPGARLEPSYVDALVRLPVFAQEVTRYSKGVWSSRLRLYPEGFFEVRLPLPSLSEQRAIVAHIAKETVKLDQLREATERTTGLLKERRAALIAAAVTGQVDVGAAA